jgi:hypothetical protein
MLYSARALNLFLALWLVFSLVVWPHSEVHTVNALIVATLVGLVAFAGSVIPKMRFANVALGLWLVLSVWLLPAGGVNTLINSLLVGFGILVTALIPNELPRHYFDDGWPLRR